MARHALVPNKDKYQDVLHTHALQQAEQLLARALLVAVVISFCDVSRRLFTFLLLILPLRLLTTRSDSVGNDARLGLCNAFAPLDVAQDQVDMVLAANCRREGLIFCPPKCLLFSKADRVQHALHLFHHRAHLSGQAL